MMRAKSSVLFAGLMFVALSCAACTLVELEPDFGPGVRQLSPPDVLGLREPIWSPDSRTLVVTYEDKAEALSIGKIYALNVDTGELDLLTETRTGTRRAQSWSSRTNEIAFYADGPKMETGIWAMAADGKGEPRFVSPGLDAAWSPSGEQMAILKGAFDRATRVTTFTISILDLSTEKTQIVFTQSDPDQYAAVIWDLAWSPDGTRVAFTCGTYLCLLDLETWNWSQLPHGGYATWSPDGQMMAYVGPVAGGETLLIRRVDGTCSMQPFKIAGYMSGSAWSPDGSKIAFVYDNRVYVMDVAAVLGEDFLAKGPECP